MLYSVRGKLMAAEPNLVVVECGGVGFKCMTTLGTQRQLPAVGSEVQLFTHLNVREDAMDLFGFYTKTELNCFRMLTAVSGVGPKVGLAILSELTPEQVAMAVACGDSKSLSRASGVGPKLAQRIALELKDKVKKMDAAGAADLSAAPGGVPSAAGNAANAVNALAVLGYAPAEAAAVVARFDSSLPTEELIRLSLKAMASRF
ncbi:Holliday junction branch migration protein RuvA [Hydrogeniiclostridium mannosilyticum]|uniref:Holliday junction branch migration complex subunit RuvA n=1 Tax=Hydrogeniiclostridium mannosilyticum TaxID=2764322 RepID=A0A328U9C7_9FIRM|nr:Holliday junction branch migration protein RuvA [Hydrogeniiclostridium mannosilyticum]MBS6164284.1 Holliday junction branch migration protein RuvA [Clostridiales bacterium]RAQ22725.1 Holliday junction branch migration protein RuvA [Hydrogeniiclostridium mannosilyticum]